MKTFNVLESALDVHQHFMLEASAGTGKTFSIENIVVRLLLEESSDKQPLDLEKILVVTFTKAATRDLKMRIRANIQRNLSFLNGGGEESPDYIRSMIAQGNEVVSRAVKRLVDALYAFDKASIFTIHSFCSRMLREFGLAANVAWDYQNSAEQVSYQKQLQIVTDFFRTGLTPELVSPLQLQLVISRGDITKLFRKLIRLLNRGLLIESPPPHSELFQSYIKAMSGLKNDFGLNASSLLEDFERLKPYYNQINAQAEEMIQRFVSLFDQDTWSEVDFDLFIADGLKWCELIAPANRKKAKKENPPEESLHYPGMSDILRKTLGPVIDALCDPVKITAVIASACQQHCQRVVEEEELTSFDALLHKMHQALKFPLFVKGVRQQFKAVIVDEFQDTDPLQWNIFHTLFPVDNIGWQGVMILVGDPKQSIYAFRQADIYTYLQASKSFGSERCLSLDCNFRSQPSLIQGLNALFDADRTPGWISLPRLQGALPYLPVTAGGKTSDRQFHDDHRSVHFVAVESLKMKSDEANNSFFYPYIAREIVRMHKNDQCAFDQFAVLVASRFEARELIKILRQWNIPCIYQTNQNLSKSKAVASWRELIEAVNQPTDYSLLKIALGGALIGWMHEDILTLEIPSILEQCIFRFIELRQQLNAEGFAGLFRVFRQMCWKSDNVTVEERLLARKNGLDFYLEYLQVAEWLIDLQGNQKLSAEKLIESVQALEEQEEEEGSVKKRAGNTEGAVKILTIHSSKGLEFDIVFAAGLIRRSPKIDSLIPIEKGDIAPHLCAVSMNDFEYLQYCDELDAEKMRQLYVALTRAKHRIYIPILFGNVSSPERGMASPIELFLARFSHPMIAVDEVYQRISSLTLSAFKNSAAALPISIEEITQVIFDITPLKDEIAVELHPPSVFVHASEPVFIHSFTSLSKGKTIVRSAEHEPPHDFMQIEKSRHTLPAGSETGTLLHLLLETVSFESCKCMKSPNELLPHVRSHVKGTVYMVWEEVIASMLFDVLHKDLGGWRLTDIKETACYREAGFLFPFNGFCKGVIDLLCHNGEKYYLIDWKTNWLGPHYTNYSQEHMHQAMKDHDYYLQANLYREALMRYLAVVDPRPFEEVYGGMYYLFLRGINKDDANGILLYQASEILS